MGRWGRAGVALVVLVPELVVLVLALVEVGLRGPRVPSQGAPVAVLGAHPLMDA